MRYRSTPLALFLSLAVATPTAAQISDIPEQSPKAETVNTALEFAQAAVAVSVFQLEAGRFAAEEAQSEEVRTFARQTTETFGTLLSEVTRVAQLEGISQGEMPRLMEVDHQRKLTRLKSAPPDRLDDVYARIQASVLEETAATFTNYAQKAGDLAALAEESLPELRDHLATARGLSG